MPTVKMIGMALVVLGVVLLSLGSALLFGKLSFSRRAQRVNGIVIGCERDSGIDTWVYRPTVRFQGADGVIVDYTPRIATSNMNYPVGAAITVLYDSQSPAKVMLGKPSSFKFWMGAAVCLLSGAGFCGVGVLMFLIANG